MNAFFLFFFKMIVSGYRGQRILLGQCGIALWFLEKAHALSLEIHTITGRRI